MIEPDERFADLLNACKAGDEESWLTFYKKYLTAVQRILERYRLARGRKRDIEEITQLVFMTLYNGGLARFAGKSEFQFRAYLRRIVLNEASEYFRSRKKQEKEVSLEEMVEYNEGSTILKTAAEEPSPEESATYEEQERLLKNYVNSLPRPYQDIFHMIVDEERSYSEIAEVLGIAEATVATRYSRIKEKLKAQLKIFSRKK